MKWLWSKMSNDWQAKLAAVFLAICAWIYVTGLQTRLIDFPGGVNLNMRNTAVGLATVSDTSQIKLKIISSNWRWRQLTADSFEAYVDLSGLSAGIYEKDVIVNSLFSDVRIIEKSPAKILVKLEPMVKKTVPAAVKISGQPAAGFMVGDSSVEPESVEIAGAKSVVESINNVEARIKLTGQAQELSQSLPVRAYNNAGETIGNLSYAPAEVKITVPIEQIDQTKQVGVNPKFVGQPASGYWLSAAAAEPGVMEIIGRPETINRINVLETEPIVLDGLKSEKTIDSKVILPEGVTFKTPLPGNQIKVKITISQLESTKEINTGFSWQNLGGGLKVIAAEPSFLKTTVGGQAEKLAKLSTKDIIYNVDLNGLTAGSHSVEIKKENFSLPEGITVISFSPSTITVDLENK